MEKRTVAPVIRKILMYDADLTKKFVTYLLNFCSFKSLRVHCKFLEISCNGIAWLAMWLAFIWLVDNKNLYQMQLNMLFGLVLDIFFIAILKAAFRRRRPEVNSGILTIGPDKFSFPSGHASRAVFILMFFTRLYPISKIWWSPLTAWALSVCTSRVIIQRHYLLDVSVGIALGIIESLLLGITWISEETAFNVITYISNDNLPGGSE